MNGASVVPDEVLHQALQESQKETRSEEKEYRFVQKYIFASHSFSFSHMLHRFSSLIQVEPTQPFCNILEERLHEIAGILLSIAKSSACDFWDFC